MKLVNDWKSVHKHLSTICMTVYMAALMTYKDLPESIIAVLPQNMLQYIGYALLTLGIVAKYIDQGFDK